MGRNAAIKRFDPRSGKNVDLFTLRGGKTPVLLELLKSPWIQRASDLVSPEEASAGKRRVELVEVEWDGERRCPRTFTYRGRRFRVDAVVQSWTAERRWWDRARRVSERSFRVMARGGVYDLTYDRLRRTWTLTGIAD